MSRAPRRTGFAAYQPFFLGATLIAIVAPPFWVASVLGLLPTPWPTDPASHGHELLLGFATALIAGFLITKASKPTVWLAFGFWLAARLAAAYPPLFPWPIFGAGFSLAFVGLMVWLAGWPFLRAARSGHNLVFLPILASLLVSELAYQAATVAAWPEIRHRSILVALDGVTGILFTMGGRIIAGLAAGCLRRQGIAVNHRLQLPWEGLGCLALAAAALADAADMPDLSRAALAVAGMAVLIRLSLWRVWRLRGERDVVLLLVGYGWLAVGLLLPITGMSRSDALHALTIGALGTLSTTMMVRSVILRRRLDRPFPLPAFAAALSLSVAAMSRLLWPAFGPPSLIVAATIWAAAYLVVLAELWGSLNLRP